MDDIVKQAMAKWPNVPACYGWLALDARGNWRMRDEAAQHANAPGDKLAHTALIGFINRNYLADERGRWYFQNGPQRVYVNLASTPYIARTDPAQGLVLHTGAAAGDVEAAYLTTAGNIVLHAGGAVAQVDDRDVAQLLQAFELDGGPASDDALMAWLDGGAGALTLRWGQRRITVARLGENEAPQRFGFVQIPTA